MNAEAMDERWRQLTALLEPIHSQAVATARRLCRTRADGDDLYQEAVLRAFDKLHTLRDESRFRSWFYATLLSRHRSRHRLRFWKRLLPFEEVFPEGREPAGEDGSMWDDEARRARRAARALSALAAEQREAIVLFEIDGYSIEEIAAMQMASVPAVKSRLTRGRERLRRFYERLEMAAASPSSRPGPIEGRDPESRSVRVTGAGAAVVRTAVTMRLPKQEEPV
jgi:RNA polymerase sigma-70 factor (ECF subfamily)